MVIPRHLEGRLRIGLERFPVVTNIAAVKNDPTALELLSEFGDRYAIML